MTIDVAIGRCIFRPLTNRPILHSDQVVQSVALEMVPEAPILQSVIAHGGRVLSGGRSNVISVSFGWWERIGIDYPMLAPLLTKWTAHGHTGDPLAEMTPLDAPDLVIVQEALDDVYAHVERQHAPDDMELFDWLKFWIDRALRLYPRQAFIATH